MLVRFEIEVDSTDQEVLSEIAYSAQTILRNYATIGGSEFLSLIVGKNTIVFEDAEMTAQEYGHCVQGLQVILDMLPTQALLRSEEVKGD